MDTETHSTRNESDSTRVRGWFATTHWSVVRLAGETGTPQAAAALEKLCRTYWVPLYSYLRRRGSTPADAQDLTQGFFERLLRIESLSRVSQEKGKFRTFLLTSLQHYMCDAPDRSSAQKRGGGITVLSLDEEDAEGCYLQVPCGDASPEEVFDRRWALTLLEKAMGRLQEEYAASGRRELFEHIRKFLSTKAGPGEYEAVGQRLGMSENGVSLAVYRLRQGYREAVRLELAQTVSSAEDLDEEINYLFCVLGRT